MATLTRIGPAPHIAVEHVGDAGPLVVFLHGIGGNRDNWQAQLSAFAPAYRAVAWDMRGYGDSDDFDGPLELDDLCADIKRVIDHFDAPRAHLVGLSMGGMIAQGFFARYPERCASLVLANTNAGMARAFSAEQKAEFVQIRRQPLLEGLEPADLWPAMRNVLPGPAASSEAVVAMERSVKALRKDAYIKALEAIVEWDFEPVLPTIDVPVQLIGSRADGITPLAAMEAMQAQITGAQLHVFDDAGHLSNLEYPEEFSRVVGAFLGEK